MTVNQVILCHIGISFEEWGSPVTNLWTVVKKARIRLIAATQVLCEKRQLSDNAVTRQLNLFDDPTH